MKKTSKALSLIIVIALVTFGIFAMGTNAGAEEIKLVGVITKIELAGKDAKSATVVLKDNKTEESVVLAITDELTLDKIKDHRIAEGDEIRCKYEVKDGKNISIIFKKTAGC